jgi:hypothetical protein
VSSSPFFSILFSLYESALTSKRDKKYTQREKKRKEKREYFLRRMSANDRRAPLSFASSEHHHHRVPPPPRREDEDDIDDEKREEKEEKEETKTGTTTTTAGAAALDDEERVVVSENVLSFLEQFERSLEELQKECALVNEDARAHARELEKDVIEMMADFERKCEEGSQKNWERREELLAIKEKSFKAMEIFKTM